MCTSICFVIFSGLNDIKVHVFDIMGYLIFDIWYYVWIFGGVLNFKCTYWRYLVHFGAQFYCAPELSLSWRDLNYILNSGGFYWGLQGSGFFGTSESVALVSQRSCYSIFRAFGYFVKGDWRWCKSPCGNQCRGLRASHLLTGFICARDILPHIFVILCTLWRIICARDILPQIFVILCTLWRIWELYTWYFYAKNGHFW